MGRRRFWGVRGGWVVGGDWGYMIMGASSARTTIAGRPLLLAEAQVSELPAGLR